MIETTEIEDRVRSAFEFLDSPDAGTDAHASALRAELVALRDALLKQLPLEIRIHCPECGTLHIDEGKWATKRHTGHSCQECGLTWKPAVVPTVGVRFLPGFKNESQV